MQASTWNALRRFATVRIVAGILWGLLASATPLAHSSEIDDIFHAYVKQLPVPDNTNGMNGPAADSGPNHSGVTFNWLEALGKRLPVKSPADLPQLVAWAQHDDLGIRAIAMNGLMQHIGFDSRRFHPGMFKTDSWMYFEILAASKIYFETHTIAFDPKLFSGTAFIAEEKDFSVRIAGEWEEEGKEKWSFFDNIRVNDGDLLITRKWSKPPPQARESVWSRKISATPVNERHQYVLKGAWEDQAASVGAGGVTADHYDIRIWFISPDAFWFKRTDRFADWKKFTRVKQPD